jgi:phosphate transport system substrate-binding protein
MRFQTIIIVITALILAACSGSPANPAQPVAQEPASQSGGEPAPTPTPALQVQPARPGSISLTGAGATFPFPLYSRWFYEYAFVDPSVRFNYQSIGSGGGIRQITARTVDFGGSDALLNDEMKANAPGLIQVPIVAGAVVPVYNVLDTGGNKIEAGVNFTPDLLVDIFLGKVNRWNDPRFAENNPEIQFPDQPIVVAHRSDGSGTTFLWVSFLSQVSDEWTSTVGVGTSVNWPVGLGGKGNEGVAGLVSEQPGSLGYVEVAYAKQNNLSFGFVQNREGNFIEPTLESIVAASDSYAQEMPDDFGQLLTNAPGSDSYPVAGYTFILMYEDMPDCVKAGKLVEFLFWAMEEGGQYAFDLLYAPLGDSVVELVTERLNSITCEGGNSLPGN